MQGAFDPGSIVVAKVADPRHHELDVLGGDGQAGKPPLTAAESDGRLAAQGR